MQQAHSELVESLKLEISKQEMQSKFRVQELELSIKLGNQEIEKKDKEIDKAQNEILGKE